MRIAVLTFEGFNELDSFIASAMINRVQKPRLDALIVCPSEKVASMNGVEVGARPGHHVADQARSEATDHRRAVLGRAGAGEARAAGRCAGVHRYAHQAVGRGTEAVVHYVAPVGQKDEYVARARAALAQYLPQHDYA